MKQSNRWTEGKKKKHYTNKINGDTNKIKTWAQNNKIKRNYSTLKKKTTTTKQNAVNHKCAVTSFNAVSEKAIKASKIDEKKKANLKDSKKLKL